MNNTNGELFKGRISAIHKNSYTIRYEGKDIPARLKGSFYDLMTDRFPVVVLTKADLCSNYGRYIREVESISDKVRAHAISALYGIGVDELQEYMRPGITICLMGSSGAGKSTRSMNIHPALYMRRYLSVMISRR